MENIVKMTEAEHQEYLAFKASQEEKKAKEARKAALETYNQMADREVMAAIPALKAVSHELARLKKEIFANFKALLDMKKDVMQRTKDGQRTHTFMTADGKARLTLGYYVIDNYKDTVNDGIAMINEVLSEFSKDDDEDKRNLVDVILDLLSKDQKGNLKASRVLQLRRHADKFKNKKLSEGVEIIMDAYSPVMSKQFIRIEERRDKDSEWSTLPLSITDAEI